MLDYRVMLPVSCDFACVMLALRLYYNHDYIPYIEMAFDCHGSSYEFSSDRYIFISKT